MQLLEVAPTRDEQRSNHGLKDPVSGLSHFAGLIVAIVAVSFLLGYVYARGDRAQLLTTAAYGLSLVALYTSSSVYHLVFASPRVTRWLRLLDHSAIYLLIAGTSTPVFHRAFHGAMHGAMLAIVWGLAALGIGLKLAWRGAPRLLYTSIYVAMGWLAVVRWSDIARELPGTVLGLVVAGGDHLHARRRRLCNEASGSEAQRLRVPRDLAPLRPRRQHAPLRRRRRARTLRGWRQCDGLQCRAA